MKVSSIQILVLFVGLALLSCPLYLSSYYLDLMTQVLILALHDES